MLERIQELRKQQAALAKEAEAFVNDKTNSLADRWRVFEATFELHFHETYITDVYDEVLGRIFDCKHYFGGHRDCYRRERIDIIGDVFDHVIDSQELYKDSDEGELSLEQMISRSENLRDFLNAVMDHKITSFTYDW